MKRITGTDGIEEQVVQFGCVDGELDVTLCTPDSSVQPDTLLHQVLPGILFLEGSHLNASEVASVLSTTDSHHSYNKIAIAVLWSDLRLQQRDNTAQQVVNAAYSSVCIWPGRDHGSSKTWHTAAAVTT